MSRGIRIDYERVAATAAMLKNARDLLLPELERPKSHVFSLLRDGLELPDSSNAWQEAYQKYHDGLIMATEGINSFASGFESFVKNMDEMDYEMAKNIRSPK